MSSLQRRGSLLLLAALLTLAVLIGGAITGVIARLACDENIHRGTFRESICSLFGNDASLLALTFVPPALVVISAAATRRRRSTAIVAAGLLICEAIILILAIVAGFK